MLSLHLIGIYQKVSDCSYSLVYWNCAVPFGVWLRLLWVLQLGSNRHLSGIPEAIFSARGTSQAPSDFLSLGPEGVDRPYWR